jgi:NAD(P)-dependent dehydrogenase (short-subunit alcohol dehydrogenase family)
VANSYARADGAWCSNNAGQYAERLAVTEDGVEATFATNYLGHFLLTRLLLGRMAETARDTGVQGRVVNVSSTVHTWFAAGDDPLAYLHRVTRKATYVILLLALLHSNIRLTSRCPKTIHVR